MEKVRCSTCFIFEEINQTRTFNRFWSYSECAERYKEAYLIFKVKNRDELMTLLEKDPFWYKDWFQIIPLKSGNHYSVISSNSQTRNLMMKNNRKYYSDRVCWGGIYFC